MIRRAAPDDPQSCARGSMELSTCAASGALPYMVYALDFFLSMYCVVVINSNTLIVIQ
jgi:hypothetical protein